MCRVAWTDDVLNGSWRLGHQAAWQPLCRSRFSYIFTRPQAALGSEQGGIHLRSIISMRIEEVAPDQVPFFFLFLKKKIGLMV